MLNLGYFKRKAFAINDENIIQSNYTPAIPAFDEPYKPNRQNITEGQTTHNDDWAKYYADISKVNVRKNRFHLDNHSWNNHQAIRQRELFDPLSLRRKFHCMRCNCVLRCSLLQLIFTYIDLQTLEILF